MVEVNYYGRLGRKLIAVGDAAQTLNFKDAASGQFLKDAFGKLQAQVQQGAPITPQPWFENQMTAAGFPCSPNCTAIVGNFFSNFVAAGDLSSTILELAENGVLNPNVALYAQTGANGYIGNYSSSSYNALLGSLRKRYSNNLQLDIDYSYSHSIDNQSNITNNTNQFSFNGQGLICDLTNLRTCRADSLFDARHIISANYVYDLPFGRGATFSAQCQRRRKYNIWAAGLLRASFDIAPASRSLRIPARSRSTSPRTLRRCLMATAARFARVSTRIRPPAPFNSSPTRIRRWVLSAFRLAEIPEPATLSMARRLRT